MNAAATSPTKENTMSITSTMKFRSNATPAGAAKVVARALVARWGNSPEYAYVLTPSGGGDLAGRRTDMSCPSYGSGYTQASQYSAQVAEVCIEEGPYEWAVELCGTIQQALDAAGADVFVEPATGYALSFYRR